MKRIRPADAAMLPAMERRVLDVLPVETTLSPEAVLNSLARTGTRARLVQVRRALHTLYRIEWVKQLTVGVSEGHFRPEYARVVELR